MWDIPAAEKAERLFRSRNTKAQKRVLRRVGVGNITKAAVSRFAIFPQGASVSPLFRAIGTKSSPQERAYKDDLRLSISAPSKMELGDG